MRCNDRHNLPCQERDSVLLKSLRFSLLNIANFVAIINASVVAPNERIFAKGAHSLKSLNLQTLPRNLAFTVMCKITYVITVPKLKLRKFHNPRPNHTIECKLGGSVGVDQHKSLNMRECLGPSRSLK